MGNVCCLPRSGGAQCPALVVPANQHGWPWALADKTVMLGCASRMHGGIAAVVMLIGR